MGEPPLIRYGGALQGLGLSTPGSGAEHKPLALLHNNDFEYSNVLALWSQLLHGNDHITITLCKQWFLTASSICYVNLTNALRFYILRFIP